MASGRTTRWHSVSWPTLSADRSASSRSSRWPRRRRAPRGLECVERGRRSRCCVEHVAFRLVLPTVLALLGSGCSPLLPTSQATAKSKWHSLREAEAAFERIVPGATATSELAPLGFDPSTNANVRILTYLEIIQRFMPNQSITKDDLDPSVRLFIAITVRGRCDKIAAVARRHRDQ